MRVLTLLIAVILTAGILIGCALNEAQIKEKIRKDLAGRQIEYYGIAGNRLLFEVEESNIIAIEQIAADDKSSEYSWQASVGSGKQPMWHLFYDSQGNFVRSEQLFVT